MVNIPIKILSDEKGYFDRECPNCMYTFKIFMKDWEEKVFDEEVHCPMCGHIDTSDKWWTKEQLEAIQNIASSWALDYISKQFDKTFKKLEQSTRNNKFFKLTYKSNRKISFINNPIGQREEWETEIECKECGTKYSVIGSAYFCPCCGYNSAVDAFNSSIDSINKMIISLPNMKQSLIEMYDTDTAETICRGLLENTLGNIVFAFQKFASCQYDKITGKFSRVNDFQIVEKGNDLFEKDCGKGYHEWLSLKEFNDMNLLFQRRHLIEHNGGLVDERYLDKTNDNYYVLGQRIVVKENDALYLLSIVKKLCEGLLTL